MYASEKTLKLFARDLDGKIQTVASDLSGDIETLHELLLDLRSQVQELKDYIKFTEGDDDES